MSNNDDTFIFETRLSGALFGNYGAIEVDFSTEFSTWIIAYCPDTDSWFCTNKRFFYYEFPDEFQCENDAINYFKNHISDFIDLNKELYPNKTDRVFLENTMESYSL